MSEKLQEHEPSYKDRLRILLTGYQVRNAKFSAEVNLFMNEVYRCLVSIRGRAPDDTLEHGFTDGIRALLGDALRQSDSVWEPRTVGEFLDWLTYLKRQEKPPLKKPPTSYINPLPDNETATFKFENLNGEALRYALDTELRDAENIEALAAFVETVNMLTEKKRLSAETVSYYTSLFRDRFWPIFEAAAAAKQGGEPKQLLYNLVNILRSNVKFVSVEQQRSLLALLN